MSAPEKSSEEILEELFFMCKDKQAIKKEYSDEESSSSDNSNKEVDSKLKLYKHKNKKKKHKKSKKRKYEYDSNYKRKRKSEDNIESKDNYMNIIKKIKKEKDSSDTSNVSVDKKPNTTELNEFSALVKKERQKTLSVITIDEVLKTTQLELLDQIRTEEEKENRILPPEKIKKEKFGNESSNTNSNNNEIYDKSLCTSIISDEKHIIKHETDNVNNSIGPRKIVIPSLKNSVIYEATIKEIEKKEHREDGESNTSSTNTDDENNEKKKDSKKSKHKSSKHSKKSKYKNEDRNGDEYKKRSHSQSHSRHKRKHHDHIKEDDNKDSSEKKMRTSTNTKQHKLEYDENEVIDRKHQRRSNSIGHIKREKEQSRDRLYDRERVHSLVRVCDRHHSKDREKTQPSEYANEKYYDSQSREKHWHGEKRSESKLSHRSSRSSNRRSRSRSVEKIDKKKLLQIARKNAMSMIQQGVIPGSKILPALKAGGKTVDELTNFCKQISKSEGVDSGDSGDETKTKAFHHPFLIKERPAIVMNIKNAVPLPTKTAQEKTVELSKQLSLQYPVSSGQQHQKATDNVWVPVNPEEKNQEIALISYPKFNATSSVKKGNAGLLSNPTPPPPCDPCPPPPLPPSFLENSIIPPVPKVDISTIVSQKLQAIRRLNENPNDPTSTKMIKEADSNIKMWVESKSQPGLFTGSTGVKPLSAAQLSGGYHVIPKKDYLKTAKPVTGDKGEALMKKMGWQPGEGLGKYKQGPAIPCALEIKTDRRGLTETRNHEQSNYSMVNAGPTLLNTPAPNIPPYKVDNSKHPVSVLNEFCSRKKLSAPVYECHETEGIARKKLFVFSVTVQGLRYTPNKPCPNKKQSKLEAATLCLQTLGIIPGVNF